MKYLYPGNFIFSTLFVFLVFANQAIAQKNGTVSRAFYKNGLVAREFYMGKDQKVDSIKTYHIVGGLDERFLFDDDVLPNGLCQKFSAEGKLKTTWLYKKGVLIKRTDYFKETNLKNKAMADENYAIIANNNELLKADPTNSSLLYQRAIARIYLQDNVLAEFDFLGFKSQLENIKANPDFAQKFPTLNRDLAEIYSRLSTIYSRFENDNMSISYKLFAIQTDPTETRHYYNLGSYLATEAHDYRLAMYYLNEVVKRVPNHNFAHWVLGYCYLELEEYEKVIENINIAIKNEANLYEFGYGNAEGDLRTLRGLAYHKVGKTDLGIADLEEAIKINPKNSIAYKHLGIVYDDLNKKEEACRYFQKSRELGYEKKYFNKELQSFIDNACNATQKNKEVPEIGIKSLPFIAPNPAENSVEVFNLPFDDFKFEIYNIDSKMLLQGNSSNKIIDVSRLSTGFYILTVSKDGKTFTFKLIKK